MVGVEDAQSDAYIPVTVVVSPDMTIAQLKDKVLMCQQRTASDPTAFLIEQGNDLFDLTFFRAVYSAQALLLPFFFKR